MEPGKTIKIEGKNYTILSTKEYEFARPNGEKFKKALLTIEDPILFTKHQVMFYANGTFSRIQPIDQKIV